MRKPPRDSVEPGERILAWAPAAGGAAPVIASDRALYLPAEGADLGGGEATRLPWEAIVHAVWEEPYLVVDATGGGVSRAWRIALAEPRRVPEVVRERVMASIVVSERIELTDDAGARVVGRREGMGDRITWTITFDPGLDPADPALREAAQHGLEELRRTFGV